MLTVTSSPRPGRSRRAGAVGAALALALGVLGLSAGPAAAARAYDTIHVMHGGSPAPGVLLEVSYQTADGAPYQAETFSLKSDGDGAVTVPTPWAWAATASYRISEQLGAVAFTAAVDGMSIGSDRLTITLPGLSAATIEVTDSSGAPAPGVPATLSLGGPVDWGVGDASGWLDYGPGQVVSDADGRYSFDVPTTGGWSLGVVQNVPEGVVPTALSYGAPGDVTTGRFALLDTADLSTVSGVLRDLDGHPVIGAVVSASMSAQAPGQTWYAGRVDDTQPKAVSVTDNLGRVSFQVPSLTGQESPSVALSYTTSAGSTTDTGPAPWTDNITARVSGSGVDSLDLVLPVSAASAVTATLSGVPADISSMAGAVIEQDISVPVAADAAPGTHDAYIDYSQKVSGRVLAGSTTLYVPVVPAPVNWPTPCGGADPVESGFPSLCRDQWGADLTDAGVGGPATLTADDDIVLGATGPAPVSTTIAVVRGMLPPAVAVRFTTSSGEPVPDVQIRNGSGYVTTDADGRASAHPAANGFLWGFYRAEDNSAPWKPEWKAAAAALGIPYAWGFSTTVATGTTTLAVVLPAASTVSVHLQLAPGSSIVATDDGEAYSGDATRTPNGVNLGFADRWQFNAEGAGTATVWDTPVATVQGIVRLDDGATRVFSVTDLELLNRSAFSFNLQNGNAHMQRAGRPNGPVAHVDADGTTTVSWTEPADNGGDAVTGYRVAVLPPTEAGAGSEPATASLLDAAIQTDQTSVSAGKVDPVNRPIIKVSTLNSVGPSVYVTAAYDTPAPTPTSTLRVSAADVVPEPVLAGYLATLTSTSTTKYSDGVYRSTPRGTAVAVQFKRSGSTAWGTVGTTSVGSSGRIAVRVRVATSGYWRVVVGRTASAADYVAAIGAVATYRLSTATSSPASVAKGAPITVAALASQLYRDGKYHPVATGTAWAVQFRPAGSTRWSTIRTGRITVVGKVSTSVSAVRSGYWRVVTCGVISKADYTSVH